MKLFYRCSIMSLLLSQFLIGQNFFPILGGQRAGTSIFTFLKIGVSARAEGMSEAVVALQQDAASIFYNPATIAQFSGTNFSASRIQWPADINYDFFAFTQQLNGRHSVGLSGGILHMEPMMETTEYLPHGTGNYFIFQDRFIGFTYGAKMTDRFSFGITVKHVQENLAGHILQTPMMDMGTFYWTGYKSLRFSASLSHFGVQAKPDGEYLKRYLDPDSGEESISETEFQEFSPPSIFRVGAAMDLIDKPGQTMIISLQLNHPVDNAENIATGVEYTFMEMMYVRTGYRINKVEQNYSFGFGLKMPVGPIILHIDYAYSNFIHLSDPVRFTLGLSLK
tara:strand:- start:2305 stop:3315 length:1011 start_codon:yes stop_codon:yes gene_type:complete